jgi:hypothetical protein
MRRRAGRASRSIALVSAAAVLLAISPLDGQAASLESQAGGAVQFIRSSEIVLDVPNAGSTWADVYLDDMQANAFVRFEKGQVRLKLPFPDIERPFRVSVVDRNTGATVIERTFRIARGLFDAVEARGSLQSDQVWRFESNARPRPDQYKTKEFAADQRGEGSARFTRGPFEAALEGEATWTDDGTKRLRQSDGSKLDMTRGKADFGYSDGPSKMGFSAGDVSIDPGVGLVNQGMSSRGLKASTSFLDERLRISGGTIYGADIRGTYRGIDAYDPENRRSALNLAGDIFKSEDFSFTTKSSLLDVRRPGAASFGIGEVVEGEENTVGGAGIDLAAFGNRIRLSGEFARSVYSNPAELNQVNEFGNSVDVGTTTGNAYKSRLDAQLWRGEKLTVSAFGGYQLVEPLFRSVQSGQIADRETWDYGLAASYDILNFDIGYNAFENNVDDIASILKTRNRTLTSNLQLSLDEFREVLPAAETAERPLFSAKRLIPSSVAFTRTRSTVESLNIDVVGQNSSINGSEIPNTASVSNSLTFSWNWSIGSTSLTMNETQFDTRQTGRETADTEDRSIGLNQSISLGKLNATFRAGLGQSENNETTTASVTNRQEAGVGFSVDLEALPVISADFDVSRSEDKYIVDNNNGQTVSWSARTVFDFTKFLPTYDTKVAPYLNVSFLTNENDVRNPNSGHQVVRNYSGVMAFGFKF